MNGLLTFFKDKQFCQYESSNHPSDVRKNDGVGKAQPKIINNSGSKVDGCGSATRQ